MVMDDLSESVSNTSSDGSITIRSTGYFISDRVLEILDNGQLFVFMPVLLTWAMLVGCVNIVTFIKMGVRDGINQNFLILSIADFLFAITQAIGYVENLLTFLGYRPDLGYISIADFGRLVRSCSTVLKNCSMIASTVIATVRCCFVTFPLHAPSIVTASRQLYAILLLCGSTCTFYITIYAHHKLMFVTNTFTNKTMLRLILAPTNILFLNYTVRYVLFFMYICIILIAVGVLINSLKSASRFREIMMTSAASDNKTKNATKKEVQVIKCVVFVALVFLICNAPYVLFSFLGYFLPGFSYTGKFTNEYQAVGIWMRVFAQLDIGGNFFGYYKFNSKFRATVNKIFCKKSNLSSEKESSISHTSKKAID